MSIRVHIRAFGGACYQLAFGAGSSGKLVGNCTNTAGTDLYHGHSHSQDIVNISLESCMYMQGVSTNQP
jgi:hypothetical protein